MWQPPAIISDATFRESASTDCATPKRTLPTHNVEGGSEIVSAKATCSFSEEEGGGGTKPFNDKETLEGRTRI